MRMLLGSCSIDTLPLILANDVSVYASFSFMLIITSFAIYMLARIFDWSSNKPLPRVVEGSAFSILLLSLVAAIAALLLVGVDVIPVFGKLGKSVLSIVEARDYVPAAVVCLASGMMLIVARWLRAG